MCTSTTAWYLLNESLVSDCLGLLLQLIRPNNLEKTKP